MKIAAVRTLRCGAGFRDFCFVKMTTVRLLCFRGCCFAQDDYVGQRFVCVHRMLWGSDCVKPYADAYPGLHVPVQDTGLVGWSEYLEERNIGVTQVIEWMGELVTGPWLVD